MDPSQSKPVKTLLSLSDEVLLVIIHKLEMCDIVQLSETCERFQRILCDRTICKDLSIPWNIGTSRHSTITFIEQRSSIITSLTLTNISWIPSDLIKSIVLNLPELKALHVAGTRFSWADLHEVLKSPLPILDKLSWTYDSNLEKSIINLIKKPEEPIKVYDELLLLREKFQQFKYLLFHVNKDSICSRPLIHARRNFQGISYIASLCTNIEEFWLTGMLEMNSFDRACSSVTENKLWDVVDFFQSEYPNLHTLVVTLASPQYILPEILHHLLSSFERNNVRNAKDNLNSSAMKLWMDPYPYLLMLRPDQGFYGMMGFRLGYNLSNLSCLSYGNFQLDLAKNITLSNKLKMLAIGQRDGEGPRNPIQIHKFLEQAPNLESITCLLDMETRVDWYQIAVNNSKLKKVTVLIADTPRPRRGFQEFAESCANIAKLPLLQKISIPLACLFPITAPDIILQYNSDQDLGGILRPHEEDGTALPDRSSNASKQNKHQRPPTGLDFLTLKCHNVKEFELGQRYDSNFRMQMQYDGMALSTISRWSLLEHLSLCKAPLIDNGEFLIKVAKSCKLKSLHLVHLGEQNAKYCTYTISLYAALKLMPHLKDFRFEQNYIGSVTPMFEALQSCHKLQRLAVFVNANFSSALLEFPEPLKLMKASRSLNLFFLSLSSATNSSCEILTSLIEEFISTRPALKVLITNEDITDKGEMLSNYVHHCDLVQCDKESCLKFYDCY